MSESIALIMQPGKSAEKILVSDPTTWVKDMLGDNVQQLQFADVSVLYDGNARKRGELVNSIISGETLVGIVLCIKQYLPIPIGLEDDRANELLGYGCFQKQKPITMSKYYC